MFVPYFAISFPDVNSALYHEPIISVEYTFSRNAIASAVITLTEFLSVAPETPIAIYAKFLRPDVTTQVFFGYIDRIETDFARNVQTVYCRDILKKALDTFLIQEVKFGIDVEQQKYYYSTYTDRFGGTFTVHEYSSLADLHANHPETVGNITEQGVKAHAVVQWLLVMCGIPEGTNIQVEESNFFIGDITPVTFHLTSVYDAIQQIVDLLGWDFYATPTGVCRFHPSFDHSYGAVCTLDEQEIMSFTYALSNEELRNYVEVYGASGIHALARAPSPFLGSTPYRGVLISNEFVDTSSIANYMAHRVLHELNRLRFSGSLTILPVLFSIVDKLSLPFTAFGFFRIESFTGSYSVENGFVINIQVSDYIDDFYYDEPDPILLADISVRYLMTVGDPKVLCILDASQATSNAGQIVSWQWTILHATSTETRTGPQVFVRLDEQQLRTTGVQVQLQITDSRSNTRIITKTLTYADVVQSNIPLYRVLYAACAEETLVSSDGGATWTSVPIPSRCVAPSHYDVLSSNTIEGAYVLVVGLNGALYRSTDMLQTYTPVAGVTGAVYAAVSAANPFTCYYASATTLYVSYNGGQTFSAAFSPASHGFGAIRMFEPDRRTATIVYLCCDPSPAYPDGALLMVNLNGNTFVDLWSSWKQPGEKPLWYVGGGFGDDGSGVSSGVQWVITTAGVFVFFAGKIGRYSGNVTALTPDLTDYTRAHVVFESQMYGDIVLDPQSPSLAPSFESFGTATPSVQHAVRDGEVDQVLYYAGSDGVYKSLDRHATIEQLTVSTFCTYVAYGPFTSPVKTTTALVVNATPLRETSYDPSYQALPQKAALFVATVASGLGTSVQTPTSGFVCIQRPNHIGNLTVTDVHAGHVVGFAVNTNDPITLPSPWYVHTYPVERYPRVPILYTPLVSGLPTASGMLAPSGLSIPAIEALTQHNTNQVEIRSLLVSQQSSPALLTLTRVTPPPFNTTGTLHRFFEAGIHTIPSGIYQGATASLQAATVKLADRVLPNYGQAGLEARLRYDIKDVARVYPATQSTLVSIRGYVTGSNKNHLVHVHATPTLTETVSSYDLDTSTDVVPVTKFAAVSYAVVQRIGAEVFYLVTNKTTGFESLSWSFPLYQGVAQKIVGVHASRKALSSSLYVAVNSALYRFSDYGKGQGTIVFQAPDGYTPIVKNGELTRGILTFSITTDKQQQKDYLAVVLRSSAETPYPEGIIAVSVDEGQTWMYHRWVLEHVDGIIIGAWWVVA